MRLQMLSAFLAVGTLLLGCGGGADDAPELVGATGTVFYNGKPLAGATVTFVIEKFPLATGVTDAEGKFSLTTGGRPGVPVGKAKVGIAKIASAYAGMPSSPKPEDMAKMAEKNRMATPKPKMEVPAKYGNPETSTLVAIIGTDASKNTYEYKLVD